MNDPLVSVVIPSLNEEKYIDRCLSSFQTQSYPHFEIIVSDGGSTDKTEEISKRYHAQFVVTKNSTVTLARQKGAEIAKGDIIVGADADTMYPKTHLEKIVKQFQSDPNRVVIGGGGIFEKKPQILFWGWKLFYAYVAFLFKLTKRVLYIPAFNLSFTKKAFLKVGGYTTYLDYGGDEIDFLDKLKKIGKIYFDKTLKVYPSSRRAKEGFFTLIIKHTLIDYYASMFLAKLFKRTIIRGRPVR
jgi:peptidoglycan-N-acetylglucosamine deacetylase